MTWASCTSENPVIGDSCTGRQILIWRLISVGVFLWKIPIIVDHLRKGTYDIRHAMSLCRSVLRRLQSSPSLLNRTKEQQLLRLHLLLICAGSISRTNRRSLFANWPRNESCQTRDRVMSHIWMSHVTCTNESCLISSSARLRQAWQRWRARPGPVILHASCNHIYLLVQTQGVYHPKHL